MYHVIIHHAATYVLHVVKVFLECFRDWYLTFYQITLSSFQSYNETIKINPQQKDAHLNIGTILHLQVGNII